MLKKNILPGLLSAIAGLTLTYLSTGAVMAAGGAAAGGAAAGGAASTGSDANQAPAQNAPAPPSGPTKGSTNEAEINATVEPPVNDAPQEQPRALISLRLYVPQMLKRTDTFAINPYTTPPPPVAIPCPLLPENLKAMSQKIINSGYNNRLSMTRPYPDGGWRWHYVYEHAKAKSGITEPHAFFQMYRFGDDMAPYALPEAKRLNRIETARKKRYDDLVQAFKDNHKDEEMEALRNGLEPVKLNFVPSKKGSILETSLYLSPGDWWITGSHKVPGLIYFWQEPIKVKNGDKISIDLTDANAILVQGGW